MSAQSDQYHMELALELAAKGCGTTTPNPMVGALVVKEGKIVGRGFHSICGGPHAEVLALKEAGEEARGAELFVTLEPCSHTGRTPPCAEAIIKAGIKRVVSAMEDPNPEVAGAGHALLREANIETITNVCQKSANKLNEAFILSIREQRPFVHLKLAATLDGKIATASGDSKWITSPLSREVVHRLRRMCGVVMVGVGTANDDDPSLTVRLPDAPEVTILRVVLDPSLRIKKDLKLLRDEAHKATHEATIVVCSANAAASKMKAIEELGARVLPLPFENGELDLDLLLKEIYKLGKMEVLLEGGGETARRFLDAGLVDRCHFFYGPKILGGKDGRAMVGGMSPALMKDSLQINDLEVSMCGPDIYLTGTPQKLRGLA
jgi:diaminohydroxyphosphoribosylaminopyrimidine deaminase/5-amino-6-(5-phosphoribosylamino)uracil reductase